MYFNNQQTIFGNGTATDIVPMVHTDPATTVLALTITDLLLIIGAGLVVGRNASVLKKNIIIKRKREECLLTLHVADLTFNGFFLNNDNEIKASTIFPCFESEKYSERFRTIYRSQKLLLNSEIKSSSNFC